MSVLWDVAYFDVVQKLQKEFIARGVDSYSMCIEATVAVIFKIGNLIQCHHKQIEIVLESADSTIQRVDFSTFPVFNTHYDGHTIASDVYKRITEILHIIPKSSLGYHKHSDTISLMYKGLSDTNIEERVYKYLYDTYINQIVSLIDERLSDRDSEFQKVIVKNLVKKDIILKVGKSHVKKLPTTAKFDRNDRDTWDDSPVGARLGKYQTTDAKMGYMAMFPVILITDDDIPNSLKDYCTAKKFNCESIVFDVEYAIARRGGLAGYPLDNDTSERHGRKADAIARRSGLAGYPPDNDTSEQHHGGEAETDLGGAILYVVYRHKEVGPLRDDHAIILEKQKELKDVVMKEFGNVNERLKNL